MKEDLSKLDVIKSHNYIRYRERHRSRICRIEGVDVRKRRVLVITWLSNKSESKEYSEVMMN